jgi:hypothetical protein
MAIRLLTGILEGLHAIHGLIMDGFPEVEAACDGMCPFASVLPRPPGGG